MDSLVISLMVKNEETVICQTLQPFIDEGIQHFLIYDTGSIDNTVSIVRDYFDKNNVKNAIIIQDNFINFSESRNICLELVKSKFPLIPLTLMIDSEWYIHNVKGLLDFCKEILNDNFDYFLIIYLILNSDNQLINILKIIIFF